MNTLIFLDTETTGLKDPRLVQLAYIANNGEKANITFKPVKPIEIGAMAISHITNEMVEDLAPFEGSKAKYNLQRLIDDGGIIVAHNAKFDVGVLEAEGIRVGRSIDTRRCAMHLYEYEGKYSLQELRYALEIYKRIDNENALAHDAMGDVIVLKELYTELVRIWLDISKDKPYEKMEQDGIAEAFIRMSNDPILIKKVTFGKYAPTGKNAPVEKEFYTWEDIATIDPSYMRWLIGSESEKSVNEQDADLLHTLNYYLQ